MKTLVLDCYPPSEFAMRLVASVELSPEFLATVKRLHEVVVGVTDHTVVVSTWSPMALFYESSSADAERENTIVEGTPFEDAQRDPERTECERLNVDRGEFWFTCHVKHEEAGEHTTARWPIKGLPCTD